MFHKLEMQKGIKYNLAAQRNSSTNADLQNSLFGQLELTQILNSHRTFIEHELLK